MSKKTATNGAKNTSSTRLVVAESSHLLFASSKDSCNDEKEASTTGSGSSSTIISESTTKGRRVIRFVSSFFSSSSSGRTSSREPSIVEKLLRRCTVFWVAFRVYIDYKWANYKAKQLKKQLGLLPYAKDIDKDNNDSDSDNHPEILKFWSRIHRTNASRLLKQIKGLAGFWVKVGQYLSTRADIMPPEYIASLAELQDSMPPKKFEDVLATISEELDADALARIESIDPEPLSTASLAQVHRATLKPTIATTAGDDNDTGTSTTGSPHEVVLKVQHRGVASLMLQDMENLRVILQLLAKTDPDLDFGPVIREYNKEVRKELDFRIEAQNMQEVRNVLRENSATAIVPETIPGLVRERVLVMDFCRGFPVKDTDSMDQHGVDRELLLERICRAWAIQMHVGGLFNADPHGANILVSTAVPGDSSVPVLLDFGLTKRLDPPIKLAFARLMHSSYEGDVDGLIRSFEEMGLKMNRHDPMEDMAAMQRGFGDTVPQKRAREARNKNNADYKRRVKATRTEAGLAKGQKLRNPVEAWPSELVFFGRVTAMLRGLCSQLDIRHPYLKTMAVAAKETIKASVPLEEHATTLVHGDSRCCCPSLLVSSTGACGSGGTSSSINGNHSFSTDLQQKLLDALPGIEKEGLMVGLQICVLVGGKEIANIAAGTIGVANPRPVTPSTLFNIFSVSKGVLTVGVLRLLQDGRIESLDDPVCKYWPAFSTNKPNITVRHLLTHQAGLASAYPEDATIDTLLDWSTMVEFIAEHATPSHEPGEAIEYHALTYAWLVGGLIEAVTKRPYEELFDEFLLPDDDTSDVVVGTEEKNKQRLFLAGISKDLEHERDLAVLSVDRREISQQERSNIKIGSLEEKETTAASLKEKKDVDDDDEEKRKKEAKKVLAKYRGLRQLMNPSVFNMRKVREAKLPSANGHASASSLAHFFHAVIRPQNPILTPDTLSEARIPNPIPSKNEMLGDSWALGLGFQLHEFVLANGDKVASIGHAGLGGSVVLAVPEEQVVVALTVNQLSGVCVARERLFGIIFDELGWQAPSTMPAQQQQASSLAA